MNQCPHWANYIIFTKYKCIVPDTTNCKNNLSTRVINTILYYITYENQTKSPNVSCVFYLKNVYMSARSNGRVIYICSTIPITSLASDRSYMFVHELPVSGVRVICLCAKTYTHRRTVDVRKFRCSKPFVRPTATRTGIVCVCVRVCSAVLLCKQHGSSSSSTRSLLKYVNENCQVAAAAATAAFRIVALLCGGRRRRRCRRRRRTTRIRFRF